LVTMSPMTSRLLSAGALLVLAGCGNAIVAEPGKEGSEDGQEGTLPDYPRITWIHGLANAYVRDVDVHDGDIFVAGEQFGPISIDDLSDEGHPPVSTFAARLSSTGKGGWLRSFHQPAVEDVRVDATGNAYVCGSAADSVDPVLGPFEVKTRSAFVGKLSPEGEPLWTAVFDATKRNRAGACALDSGGRVVFGIVSESPITPPQPLAAEVSSDGALTWTLFNGAPAVAQVSDAYAAVGPSNEVYLWWRDKGSIDPDLGAPFESVGGGTLASFTSGKELSWIIATTLRGARSITASPAGVLAAGMASDTVEHEAHLYSPEGELTWVWPAPTGVQLRASIFDSQDGAWVTAFDATPGVQTTLLFHLSPAGVEIERLELGAKARATAIARLDDRHLVVGGANFGEFVANGEVMEAGSFLAIVETAPP
jgi:hypothetical protein